MGDFFVSAQDLVPLTGTAHWPQVVDVRRRAAYEVASGMLPACVWRDHRALANWAPSLCPDRPVVVYCLHGEQVSQSAVALLRARGLPARALRGGIDGWVAAGGVLRRRGDTPMAPLVLPLRPGAAEIAGAWLWRRFADPDARFLHVEAAQVGAVAAELSLAETPPYEALHDQLFLAAGSALPPTRLLAGGAGAGLHLRGLLEAAYLSARREDEALETAFAIIDAVLAQGRAMRSEDAA